MKVYLLGKREIAWLALLLAVGLTAGMLVGWVQRFVPSQAAVLSAAEDGMDGADTPLPAGTGKRLVILDAGHGGMDSGAVGINGALEKEINLQIARILRDMLALCGIETVMTREADISLHEEGLERIALQKRSDLQNRLALMEANPEAIFVSIHQNEFTQPQYRGAQVFYNERDARNRKLAHIIQDAFVTLLQPDNTRVEKTSGSEYYLLYHAPVPAVLVECGFLSNPEEAALLADADYQHRVAFVLLGALLRFYEGASAFQTAA